MLWTFEDLLRRVAAVPGDPLQALSSLRRRLHDRTGRAASRAAPGWSRDPLSHPALRAMSQRDLGDLPFDPRAIAED